MHSIEGEIYGCPRRFRVRAERPALCHKGYQTKSTKPTRRLSVQSRESLRELLLLLTPHLVVKKYEAEQILLYLNRACLSGHYRPTKEDFELYEQLEAFKKGDPQHITIDPPEHQAVQRPRVSIRKRKAGWFMTSVTTEPDGESRTSIGPFSREDARLSADAFRHPKRLNETTHQEGEANT